MQLGNLKVNENGNFSGQIATAQRAMTIALGPVNSDNEAAPKYHIFVYNRHIRNWVKVGALWEYFSNSTGVAFYAGKIDDPDMPSALNINTFPQDDGSMNVVWTRPQRRRENLPNNNANANQTLPDLPPVDNNDMTGMDGGLPLDAPQTEGEPKRQSRAKSHKLPEGADA